MPDEGNEDKKQDMKEKKVRRALVRKDVWEM